MDIFGNVHTLRHLVANATAKKVVLESRSCLRTSLRSFAQDTREIEVSCDGFLNPSVALRENFVTQTVTQEAPNTLPLWN